MSMMDMVQFFSISSSRLHGLIFLIPTLFVLKTDAISMGLGAIA